MVLGNFESSNEFQDGGIKMASVWKSPHNLMGQNKVAGCWRILTANLRNIELVVTDERLTGQFHCILKGLRDYSAVPQARKWYMQNFQGTCIQQELIYSKSVLKVPGAFCLQAGRFFGK